MKAINYYLSFGIKPTLKKILSVLVSKYAPKKLFLENKDKGIKDIPEINTINTENKSQDYADYLKIQIKTSVSRTRYINPLKRFIQSRSQLIERLTKTAKNHNLKCKSILSVGSRDDNELDNISCFFPKAEVRGLDLFSASPRITTGDMHNMPFDDNSFDATIAIHSMEHSYDPSKSLGEMFRVTKEGGVICIEVPVCFETNATDRTDYKNLLNLLSFFKKDSIEVLWEELENRESFSKPPNLRVIVQKIAS